MKLAKSVVTTFLACCLAAASDTKVIFRDLGLVEAGGMQNVHLTYREPISGRLSIHFGECDLGTSRDAHHCLGVTYIGSHSLAKRHIAYDGNRPTRFVWLPPKNIPNGFCLHAFTDDKLVGTSLPIRIARRKIRRKTKSFADVADPEGPWFDGVQYLQQKEPDSTFVAQTKSKRIGIIGGGMSGLMTSHLLDSVGMYNWHILEASNRVGGRVHTSYLNGTKPTDYQYQELGAMRFPVSIKYSGTNETLEIKDHRMVFQLAAALNAIHGSDSLLAVNFIPWIQYALNDPADTGKRRPDGTVPGMAEIQADPSLADNLNATYSNATTVAIGEAAYGDWLGLEAGRLADIAENVFRAHKQAIKDGLFDYSESMYLRYVLHNSVNVTDQIDSTSDYYPAWPYENVYFSATTWKTIDKGLSSLPRAFEPLVHNRTTYGIKVSELQFDNVTQKISAHWREQDNLYSMDTKSADFDYAIVAVPFSRVRVWRLPPYSLLLTRAINTLNYDPACKVALHYKSRFWEHLPRPIIGGCGSTDIPGIQSICYPSYKINSTGPGVILANYVSGALARSLSPLPEKEHVALTQRAMVEIHGSVAAEQFTGIYDRICWHDDENQAGAWCGPLVGQEELYLPAYYQTEMKTVFVGEHTSFTHAWIFSALESAVRGTAQLLLDMGLVDEAKEVTTTWMARWMNM